MLVPGRHYNSEKYRFAFQGQEKDDEINGSPSTSYAYTFRMHDTRIGRFWSLDPLMQKYPYWSPYTFSGNRVIDAFELEGAEPKSHKSKWNITHAQGYGGGVGSMYLVNNEHWMAERITDEGVDYLYYNPETGWEDYKMPEFVGLADELETIPINIARLIHENSSFEIKYTGEVGYGEADYNRFLGFQLSKGVKATGAVQVVEIKGLKAIKSFFNDEDIFKSISLMDNPKFKLSTKYSKGIYAGSGGFDVSLNNGEMTGKANIKGSYAPLFLNTEFSTKLSLSNARFMDTKLKLEGGLSFWEYNKKSFTYRNGMNYYSNINIEYKFSISGFIDDFLNKPMPTKY